MSAMESMFASMLAKMVPPEVLAALSPEKIQEYSEQVQAVMLHFKSELEFIKQMQMQNADMLSAIMERLDNVECKYTGGRKPKPIGSGDGNTFIG